MTSVHQNLETEIATRAEWVKPEIASFEPVSASQSITSSNPGDILSSNS